MARGFESKSVGEQQEEAQRGRAPRPSPGDPTTLRTRRTLELARVDVLRRLAAASSELHRSALRQALDDLERQLAALPKVGPEP